MLGVAVTGYLCGSHNMIQLKRVVREKGRIMPYPANSVAQQFHNNSIGGGRHNTIDKAVNNAYNFILG